MRKEQVLAAPACTHDGCNNFARKGHQTCRWHDPEVLEARAESEAARQRALRAAGVA